MTINEVKAQIALGTMDRTIIHEVSSTTSNSEILQILFDHLLSLEYAHPDFINITSHFDLAPFALNPHTPQSVQNHIVKTSTSPVVYNVKYDHARR